MSTLTNDARYYIGPSGSDSGAASGLFDPTITGAGTNFANSATPLAVFSSGSGNRLNCSDHTGPTYTLTSDGTPFNSSVVGNGVVITGGTHFVPGYYMCVGYNSSSSIELADDPTDGSNATLGTGAMGGWFASPKPLCTGCSTGAPTITTPLKKGNEVYIVGSGQDEPTVATYSWPTGFTFPTGGNYTDHGGFIKFISTSGKIRLHVGAQFAACSGHLWKGWSFKATNSGSYGFWGADTGGFGGSCVNPKIQESIFDQNGYGVTGCAAPCIMDCGFINSGEGSVLTSASAPAYNGTEMEPSGTATGHIIACTFVNWKSAAAIIEHSNWQVVEDNLIAHCDGLYAFRTGTANSLSSFWNNTVAYFPGDGMRLFHYPVESSFHIGNNLFVEVLGTAMVDDPTDEGHDPRRFAFPWDYNFFYNCGSNYDGTYITGGPHDVQLTANPFIDGPGYDFRLNTIAGGGAAVRGGGRPQRRYGTVN